MCMSRTPRAAHAKAPQWVQAQAELLPEAKPLLLPQVKASWLPAARKLQLPLEKHFLLLGLRKPTLQLAKALGRPRQKNPGFLLMLAAKQNAILLVQPSELRAAKSPSVLEAKAP